MSIVYAVRQGPVLERVLEELTKYWEAEAGKGRSIEEFARFPNYAVKVKYIKCFSTNTVPSFPFLVMHL